MKTTADQINYLNVGLMIASCLVAYIVPFELFLFSYAVLGPLHYLTEISWLHDRGYFMKPAREARGPRIERYWVALVVITLVVMMYGLLAEKVLALKFPPTWEIGLLYMVFLSAYVVIFVRSAIASAAVIGTAAVALAFFSRSPSFGLVAVFLVTIVHVLVFTAAFVLHGALKSRSRSGILSLVVFAACAVSFFVFVPAAAASPTASFVRSSYSSFQTLNAELLKLLQLGPGNSLTEIYDSSEGLMVMRLIAFAYTYHYLNWFSKTSIIKWHEIPRARTIAILGLWVASLGLYAYSYELGFIALYILSVLHVMLEFPLNHQSFAGIGKELFALVRRPARASARS